MTLEGEADAEGNLDFADLTPGDYAISGGLSTDFGEVVVFCAQSKDLGVEFPSTTSPVPGGPGAYVTELTLSTGDAIVCDVYAIPADLGGPEPTEASDEPEDAQESEEPASTEEPESQANQTADAGRPANLFTGTCGAELDVPPIADLTELSTPGSDAVGADGAIRAESSFTTVAVSLDDMLAADHSIGVFEGPGGDASLVVCGAVGGVLDETGALAIGLLPVGGSGYAGIAYLSPNPDDPAQTNVTVFLAEGLGNGDAGEA